MNVKLNIASNSKLKPIYGINIINRNIDVLISSKG